MNLFRLLVLFSYCLLGALDCAISQVLEVAPQEQELLPPVFIKGEAKKDPAWISYRDSYKAMKAYSENVKDSDPLIPMFRLAPLNNDAAPRSSSLQLRIVGKERELEVPLDHYWGVLPLDEELAAEGGDFYLNAPPGTFGLIRTITIKPLPGGMYPEEYLRSACERTRQVLKGMNIAYKLIIPFKKCLGVKFVVDRNSVDAATLEGIAGDGLVVESLSSEYYVFRYMYPESPSPRVFLIPGRIIAIASII